MAHFEELVFTAKGTSIITIVLTAIYGVVLTPLCLYYCYNLWKLNQANVPFFAKRHTKIVICNVILFNIYILIIRTVANFTRLYHESNSSQIVYPFLTQSAQFPIVFICVRLWLSYYDYSSATLMMSTKWKAEILKDDVPKPWTSRYRWAGNPKVVIFIGCVFAAVVVFIIVSLPQLLFLQTLPVLYALFLIIMMIKIHSCRDQFYIRNEFFVCMLWIIGCFIIYIPIHLLVPTETTLRFVVMNIFVSFAAYTICLISTLWIIIQYKKQQRMVKLEKETSSSSLYLSDVFRNEDRFELFAHHLVTEFSIENLTFILEVMQIKQQMITHKLLNVEDVGLIIDLPSGTIKKVRRKNAKIRTLHQLKENMNYIMDEYVFRYSEHCINVSSKTRMRLLTAHAALEEEKINETVEDLVERNLNLYTGTNVVSEADREMTKKYAELMDDAINEISALMQKDSLLRFAMTQREHGTLHKMSESIRNSLHQ